MDGVVSFYQDSSNIIYNTKKKVDVPKFLATVSHFQHSNKGFQIFPIDSASFSKTKSLLFSVKQALVSVEQIEMIDKMGVDSVGNAQLTTDYYYSKYI